jgi:hypothetical protein
MVSRQQFLRDIQDIHAKEADRRGPSDPPTIYVKRRTLHRIEQLRDELALRRLEQKR